MAGAYRRDAIVASIGRDARLRRRGARRGCGPGSRYATLRTMRASTADRAESAINPYLICIAAWAVPGAGHLWLGRRQKGITFLLVLVLMFATGLWLEGRLFPF